MRTRAWLRVGCCPHLNVVSIRNHKGALSLKHNKASFGGKPDNPYRPTFAAGTVTALDEFTKCQCLLFLIGLHNISIRRADEPPLLGVSPIGDSRPP